MGRQVFNLTMLTIAAALIAASGCSISSETHRCHTTETRIVTVEKELSMANCGQTAEAAGQAKVERAIQRASQPPRKIIVATCVYPMYAKHPGLQARLDALGKIVDAMTAESQAKYGRGIDLAALPETAVNAGLSGPPIKSAVPLEGPVLDAMAAVARRNNCYLVLPMYRLMDNGRTENVAVILDRQGKVMGQYSKIHCVDSAVEGCLEGGIDGGRDVPVFQCDFGRLGVQICYDMTYDDGWQALEDKGADLVVWTTMSPGQRKSAAKALTHRYFVMTSTWRNNAGLYDPTGDCVADRKSVV